MQYPDLDEVRRQHEPQSRSSLMDDEMMPEVQAPQMTEQNLVSQEPQSVRLEISEENILQKLAFAKKRVHWKKKSLTCCSACIAALSTMMFLCACYRITIWPPPYYAKVANRANANSLAEIGIFENANVDNNNDWAPRPNPPQEQDNQDDPRRPPQQPWDERPPRPDQRPHDRKGHHDGQNEFNGERPHDRRGHHGDFDEERPRHNRGGHHAGRQLGHHGLDNEKAEAMYGDHDKEHHKKEHHKDKKGDHHKEKHHEGKNHHNRAEMPEELDFSNVDTSTMKHLHRVDRVHLRMNIVGMIFCTLLFGLAMLGFRAKKQKTYHKARRYFKKSLCASILLVLVGIYGAFLKVKFHHKLERMFDHQIEYLMKKEQSRNLQEFSINVPNAGTIKHHLINSANPEHLRSPRNGKKALNHANAGPVIRQAPINVPNQSQEPNEHGRMLMPEKDLIKKALGRMGSEISKVSKSVIKEFESHIHSSNVNTKDSKAVNGQNINTHGTDLTPKKWVDTKTLSQPKVQQEAPVAEEPVPEIDESVEAVKAEFSSYLSEEDMERMDQLITGINAWANKYGKNAEDFYPDVEDLTTEDEEEVEAVIEDEEEDYLIGGDDHDLWWFTEEERQEYRKSKEEEHEEFFGITIEIDENGEITFNIERDIWMGLPTAEAKPKLEMTIEVPDSWEAWTSEEQAAWLEFFNADEWEGLDWQKFRWQELSNVEDLDQWSEDQWELWAMTQQKLVLEHAGAVPEFWEEWSDDDQLDWAYFFRPEDWAGHPSWKKFDWDDLTDDCETWTDEQWLTWANGQQEFWNKYGDKAPEGFQYWDEKDQKDWLAWFNPADWQGVTWQKFDWSSLEDVEDIEQWTLEDWTNWALEQQAAVDEENYQGVPNDFNEWDEESQQYFLENFDAKDWEGLFWQDFNWLSLADKDYMNWSGEDWRNWQLNQQLTILKDQRNVPEFFNMWEEKDQLNWAASFRPDDWSIFPSWRRFDWADPEENNCQNWNEADWVNWAISQQQFWDSYADRAPDGFQYWDVKDQKEWLAWFNPADWEGTTWKKFNWADLQNYDLIQWNLEDWEKWAARQQAYVDKRKEQQKSIAKKDYNADEIIEDDEWIMIDEIDNDWDDGVWEWYPNEEPEVPYSFDQWREEDQDYFLENFDANDWEGYDWKEFDWTSLGDKHYRKWNDHKWQKWAKKQQKKVNKIHNKEERNDVPWGFEEWDRKDKLAWKAWFNAEDWEGYDWYNFNWADLENYNTWAWNDAAWIKWADSQQSKYDKVRDRVPEGWQYWDKEDQREWLNEFDPEDWEGYDWKQFDWADLDNYSAEELDDWSDYEWQDWASQQQNMFEEREEDEHREHSEQIKKHHKKHHKNAISKAKDWIVDWFMETTSRFWSVDNKDMDDWQYGEWEEPEMEPFDEESWEDFEDEWQRWDDDFRAAKRHEMREKRHHEGRKEHHRRNGRHLQAQFGFQDRIVGGPNSGISGRMHGGRKLQAQLGFSNRIVGGPNRGISSRMSSGRKLAEEHVVFFMQTAQVFYPPKNKPEQSASTSSMDDTPLRGHMNEKPQFNDERPARKQHCKGGHHGQRNGGYNNERPPQVRGNHHGGHRGHFRWVKVVVHFLFWVVLLSVHVAKVYCYSMALAKHEYLINIHKNGQQCSMNMDQKVDFYEQAPKAQKKQKKAVKKQMKAQAKATSYIPPTEPLLEDRTMVDPEKEPLNYSFYQEEPNVPTYTLEQVQTLLEAQRLRMMEQFNRQMNNAMVAPTGEQLAQDLQRKQ